MPSVKHLPVAAHHAHPAPKTQQQQRPQQKASPQQQQQHAGHEARSTARTTSTAQVSAKEQVAGREVIGNRHQANLRNWQPTQAGTVAGAHVAAAGRNGSAAGVKRAPEQARFNQQLRTDRAPGDPDRNRELNRARTNTHNGHPVFEARVHSDANFFDKSHRSLGQIKAGRVDIDFTVAKRRMAGPDGVKHTYVYARRSNADGTTTGGYVRQSNFTNYKRDVGDSPFRFSLTPGKHQLVDGAGKERGQVIDSQGVRLNFGQQKTINGERHYYAFDTLVDHDNNPATKKKHLSGWIPESAIPAGERPAWRSGGDVRSAPAAPTEGAAPRERTIRQAPADVRREYAGLSVTPSHKGGVGRRSPLDYLGQRDGAINITFNLPGAGGKGGGLSTDTLMPGATFHRTPSVDPVRIPLYKSGTNERSDKTMTFVYGFVQDPSTGVKRHGWIAQDALKQP